MSISAILVATDLSERSDAALERAVKISAKLGARLHVLHVVDDSLPAAVAREMRANIRRHLAESVVGFCKDRPQNAQVEIRRGTVWKTVLAVAEDAETDLIVLGSHRSRGLVELFRGTTLDRVARSAPVPLLMVKADPQADYRHVAVGVDFSRAALNAVTQAIALSPEARFSLVSTYQVLFREFIDRAEPGDSDIMAEKKRIESELKDQMLEFVKSCPEHPKGYKSVFLEDDPADGLGNFAVKEGVDLISVGSNGRSWVARVILGNTASELLYTSPCDVLVAKP